MFTPPRITRRTALFLLAIAVVVVAAVTLAPRHPTAGNYDTHALHEDDGAGAPMTVEAMQRWVREFYETNPIVGRFASTGAPVATFLAAGVSFNADANTGTVIDTVQIMLGETVRWQRLVGIHTVTSGTGALDANVGSLFDVPLDAASPVFDFTFTQAGTFPFFCRPHETFQMKGAVIVEDVVGVAPLRGPIGEIGFTRGPTPNPTRGTTSFRFALPMAGKASARVYDARGRLVAELVNERLEPGSYGAVWDGRDRSGNLASPGVYFVNLQLPDHRDSRRVVLSR